MNDPAQSAGSPLTPRPARGGGSVAKKALTKPTPL